MDEEKMNNLEERLSMELKRFGVPYAGKRVQSKATGAQLSAALDSMNECLKRAQKPSNTKASYTDTDLFH